MHRYPIIIFFSEEDNCYVAEAPDLKGCSAVGDTPEEALKEIQVAIKNWLEIAKEKGISIPKPSRRAA
ncbi:type II toxin-antitoxin system HicB family antitoxin [Thermodesulfatator atlanticus]|uniref:type II toxin-antitoxin system HicB family antitoxin n=1 Tax=Thermodesulfatator atlanticus TaxID=501497 RepID=UPI0003B536D1|nr:type II toxin-antitoxin system HicB family antitoxin [Thermodesulfatator atlanticus]